MLGEIELDILLASGLDLICTGRALVVRQDVWIWVHPSSAIEAEGFLGDACKRHGCVLTLAPLKRIEVRGPGSESALLSIIKVKSSSPMSSLWTTLQKERQMGGIKPWSWPLNLILGLETVDPRLSQLNIGGLSLQGITIQSSPDAGISDGNNQAATDLSIWTRDAINLLELGIDQSSTASVHGPIPTLPLAHPLPMSSDQVSSVRRQWRKNLSSSKPSTSSDSPSSSSELFPVLIVRRMLNHEQASRFDGFSLLLPMGWVTPVWYALALKGARAAGQQEWRWIASGGATSPLPCFPHDFPYTSSGASLLADIRQRDEIEAGKRPKGKARRVKDASAYVPWSTGIGREFECLMSTDRDMSVNGKEAIVDEWIMMPRPRGGEGSKREPLADKRWKERIHLGSTPRHNWSDLCSSQTEETATSFTAAETRVERKMRRALEQHFPKQERDRGNHSKPQMMDLGKIVDGPMARAFAYVSVRIAGKGKCEAGAAIVIPRRGEETPNDHLPRILTVTVVGYVTSSSPRGRHSPGSRPGGLAICHIPTIIKHLNHDLACAEYAPGLKAWIKNPDSPALRKATIKPLAMSGQQLG